MVHTCACACQMIFVKKYFRICNAIKNGDTKKCFHIENSWPRFTRAIKNGWEKRSYDVCSLNKIHDFENPSRPFAWAFCKSLSWMPTLETFEDDPEDESKGEEMMNAIESMIEELSIIDNELQSDLKFKDRAMIELIRARNGLIGGLFLGAIHTVAHDLPDVTSALLENNPEEILSFQN